MSIEFHFFWILLTKISKWFGIAHTIVYQSITNAQSQNPSQTRKLYCHFDISAIIIHHLNQGSEGPNNPHPPTNCPSAKLSFFNPTFF